MFKALAKEKINVDCISSSEMTMSCVIALEDIERDAIVRALEQTRYNKTAAAKLLGITFRALRYRLKKLGLE